MYCTRLIESPEIFRYNVCARPAFAQYIFHTHFSRWNLNFGMYSRYNSHIYIAMAIYNETKIITINSFQIGITSVRALLAPNVSIVGKCIQLSRSHQNAMLDSVMYSTVRKKSKRELAEFTKCILIGNGEVMMLIMIQCDH